MIKVAIDAMGGDFAPKEQIKGTIEALKNRLEQERKSIAKEVPF